MNNQVLLFHPHIAMLKVSIALLVVLRYYTDVLTRLYMSSIIISSVFQATDPRSVVTWISLDYQVINIYIIEKKV